MHNAVSFHFNAMCICRESFRVNSEILVPVTSLKSLPMQKEYFIDIYFSNFPFHLMKICVEYIRHRNSIRKSFKHHTEKFS